MSKKPRLTGRTMQGVLKLPAWIGAAAKCGACINLCTLLLLAKTGDCTFVLGTLGAGILSTCPHVPHGLKAWPRQLATLSTQTSCNLNLPQNLMKCPKNQSNVPQIEKKPQNSTRLTPPQSWPQSSATAACNAFHSNSLHPTAIYFFCFFCFPLKLPPP